VLNIKKNIVDDTLRGEKYSKKERKKKTMKVFRLKR
jgi:hypothetical protein